MPFKVTIFFQQQSTLLGGWGTNFWNSSGNISFVQTATQQLRDNIAACTGAQVWTPRSRISDSQVFRNVFFQDYPASAPQPISSVWPDADYPNTALLLKLTASGNYSVRMWMRGIPDNIVDNSGRYDPTAQFKSRLKAFFGNLTDATQTWCVNVLDRTVTPRVITAISQLGVVTCPLHNYPDQSVIRIKGTKGLTQANGKWRITVIDSNSYSLNFWVAPAVAVPATGNPTSKLQTYTQVQIASCEVVRASSHKTGRPIGLLGGRRRTRKKASA